MSLWRSLLRVMTSIRGDIHTLFVALFLFSRSIQGLSIVCRKKCWSISEKHRKNVLDPVWSAEPCSRLVFCFFNFYFEIYIDLVKLQPNQFDLQGNKEKLSSFLYSILLLCQIVSQLGYLCPSISSDVWQHKGMSFMCFSILCTIIRSSKF